MRDYFGGLDDSHPLEMSPRIEHNAGILLDVVNRTLVIAALNGARATVNPHTGTVVRVGWRPPSINRQLGGSQNSLHMTGMAIDIHDTDGSLGQWAMFHVEPLVMIGVWCRAIYATPGWVHMQSMPPPSRERFFTD